MRSTHLTQVLVVLSYIIEGGWIAARGNCSSSEQVIRNRKRHGGVQEEGSPRGRRKVIVTDLRIQLLGRFTTMQHARMEAFAPLASDVSPVQI